MSAGACVNPRPGLLVHTLHLSKNLGRTLGIRMRGLMGLISSNANFCYCTIVSTQTIYSFRSSALVVRPIAFFTTKPVWPQSRQDCEHELQDHGVGAGVVVRSKHEKRPKILSNRPAKPLLATDGRG